MALASSGSRPLLRAAGLVWPVAGWLQECIQAHQCSIYPKNESNLGSGGPLRVRRAVQTSCAVPQQAQRRAVPMSAGSSMIKPPVASSSSISRQLLGSEMHKCNGQGRYEATVKVFEQFVGHAQEAADKNGGKMPPEWQLTEEELLMYLDAIRKSAPAFPAAEVQKAINTAKRMGVRVGGRSQRHYVKALCEEGEALAAFNYIRGLQQAGELDFETVSYTVMALIAGNHGWHSLVCGLILVNQCSRIFKSALPEQRRLLLHWLIQAAADFRRLQMGHVILLKAEELGEEVAAADLIELLGAAAESDDKLYCEIFLSMLDKRRRLTKVGPGPPLQVPEGALLPVLNAAARLGDSVLGIDAFNMVCESLSEPPWRPAGSTLPDAWQPTPPTPCSFHAIIHTLVNAAQLTVPGPERTTALNSAFNYLYQLEAAYHTQPRVLSPRHGLAFFVEAMMCKSNLDTSTQTQSVNAKQGVNVKTKQGVIVNTQQGVSTKQDGSTTQSEELQAVAGSEEGTVANGKQEEGGQLEGEVKVEEGEGKEDDKGADTRRGRMGEKERRELSPDSVLEVLNARRASGQMVTTSMLNVVLSACSRMAHSEEAMMQAAQLFDSYPTDFGVGHNIDSVNCLVKNAISTPAAVDALLRFIEDNGLQATSDTYAEMMESYVHQSNVDGFLQAMRRSIKAGFEPSATMLQQGLDLAKRINHREGMRRLTVELQTLGIIPVGVGPRWTSPRISEGQRGAWRRREQDGGDRREHYSEDRRGRSGGDRREQVGGDRWGQYGGDRSEHYGGDRREQYGADREGRRRSFSNRQQRSEAAKADE